MKVARAITFVKKERTYIGNSQVKSETELEWTAKKEGKYVKLLFFNR